MIPSRQRDLLQRLWSEGSLSRWELHERTGIRPNTVGSDSAALLESGIIREGDPTSQPRSKKNGDGAEEKPTADSKRLRGRPRVPLEIDPQRRHVLGLAIRPGRVEIAKLNLLGELMEEPASRKVKEPGTIIRTARDLLQEEISEATLCIGLATPGFVDPVSDSILFSSAWPGFGEISLEPIHDIAGTVPYVLENDMHALAARWLLTHRAEQSDDVLLVYFDDGQIGSAILIAGRPNRGCVTAANELGHTRLPVETERCYCGRVGCLERIFSTDHIRRHGVKNKSLAESAKTFQDDDEAMAQVIEHFAMGMANAVNFFRPNRLVLVSELTGHDRFSDALEDSVRGQTLKEIIDRVQVERWQQPAAQSAETAGWLGLASLYYEGWLPENAREKAEALAAV